MIDFNRIDRENAEWRAFAKKEFLPGIDSADLKVGDIVTISPNLMIRDRSGTNTMHEVIAVNQTHVQMKASDGVFSGEPALWLLHEHHFYMADTFHQPLDGSNVDYDSPLDP